MIKLFKLNFILDRRDIFFLAMEDTLSFIANLIN